MRFLKDARENFKKWEIGLFAMVSTIILVGLYLIFTFNFETNNHKNENYLAKIVRLYGDVKYKEFSQSYFNQARLDYLINQNGEVYTENNSEVIIKLLESNSIVELRPQSLIKLLKLKNGAPTIIELIDGVINLEVLKGKEVWIKSNEQILKLRSDKEDIITTAYLSMGKIVLSRDINDIRKSDELDVVSPAAGEKTEADEGIKIKMNVAAKYEMQISKDPGFKNIIATAEFEGSDMNWNLPIEEGLFYLKIIQAKNSKIYPIYIESKYKLTGIRPKDGETISIYPGGKFMLSWNPAGAESYRVTIKDSFDHEEALYTTRNEIEINNIKGEMLEISIAPELEPNKYSNIKKVLRLGLNFTGSIVLKQDSLQNVYLENTKDKVISWESRENELYRIRIIDLDKNIEVGIKNTTTNSIELPKLNIGSYKLEISSVNYPTMRKAIHTFDIKTPIVTWGEDAATKKESENPNEKIKLNYSFNTKDDLGAISELKYYSDDGVTMIEKKIPLKNNDYIEAVGFGKYCVTIKPEIYSKNITASEELCFLLKKKSKFADLDPLRQEMVKRVKSKRGTYTIEIPKVKKAVRYVVETYKEKGQEKVQFDSNTNTVEIELSNTLDVYMRYKVFDKDKNESNFSPMTKINLK